MNRITSWALSATAIVTLMLTLTACSGEPVAPASAEQAPATPAAPQKTLENAFLQWPLPRGAEIYGSIDGKRMHRYVVEQAEIARRYRDQGHAQFWGRIIGSSADAESAQWVAEKFKQAGLSEVRIQPIDLPPQWMPSPWEVTATGGGKTVRLDGSAQPFYRTEGTRPEGLDLEAVYVGLGSEADFIGKDVKGKAVFTFSVRDMRSEGAVQRADTKGAAAIFDVKNIPGNMRYQAYPVPTKVPTFSLGNEDGYAVRDLIVQAGPGKAPRVKIKMEVQMVPNLKTALVWGKLPGATDETVYIIAHRDGWFDASGDNAAGVAALIGLAEHYAKLPQAQRRRTMVFIGMDGHHNTGPGKALGEAAGDYWLLDHKDELFGKTALVINSEHPSTVQTYVSGTDIGWANTTTGQQWYAGGPSRPELGAIAVNAFKEFGVATRLEPNPEPPAGDLGYWADRGGPDLWRYVPGVATSDFFHYFHTDKETPETVPWTGLEATARAYARIIDEVNKLELKVLQRPPQPLPRPPGTP